MTIKHKSFLLILFFFIISSCAINDQKDLNYSNQDPIIGTILEITKVMIERDSISKNAIELIEGVELLIQTNESVSKEIISNEGGWKEVAKKAFTKKFKEGPCHEPKLKLKQKSFLQNRGFTFREIESVFANDML